MLYVRIKKKHFHNSKYSDNSDCPLAQAIMENAKLFGLTGICVGKLIVDLHHREAARTRYKIQNGYTKFQYCWDKFKAWFIWNPETVIRTVVLK